MGSTAIALPDRLNDFLTPVMVAVSLGLVALVAWTVFRPPYAGRRAPGSGLPRARELVARHGGDSLAPFVLRADRELFFHGDSVVAYSVVGRVCLASPDPVGPSWERDQAWGAFHEYADSMGWPVAVLGASQERLPVYRRAGMRELYVGDEALVDCRRFQLDPSRARDLRASVVGVVAAGYRVEFLDPARLDAYLESGLRGLATEVRPSDAEQRLSMTLGRLFDPEDRGLLMAVAIGPDGHPAAFCQFVPAPGIDGYTLDQIRHTTRTLTPGIVDLLVIETILHLGEGGVRNVGLNFAVVSRRMARSDADGLGGRAQRWLLDHLSHAGQGEGAWRADNRYEPEWRPRYFVYDCRGHFPAAAVALARAEAHRPLPSVGPAAVPTGDLPPDARCEPGRNGRKRAADAGRRARSERAG